MTPPAKKAMAGRQFGNRYTLLAYVAQGGMGEVWKARDRQTGQLVAVKILRAELSGQELSLWRLRLEAMNGMRIQHPNIANILDSGEEDGLGWIVMELVDGPPLTKYLANGTRMSPADLIPILMQMAMALGAAERAGVTHRDIKPANILIRKDGVAKLTDFGISRTSDQVTLTADGMVMGTAQYLPPEQAMGHDATPAGDVYALGVIAYEALAGRRPYTGASQVDIAFAHVNEALPPLPDDVPKELAQVVTHMLEKDPARRPQSGATLAREISAAAQALGIDAKPHPLASPHGVPDTAPTSEQPVVAPVRHERRSHVPAEMLEPVDMSPEPTQASPKSETSPKWRPTQAEDSSAQKPAPRRSRAEQIQSARPTTPTGEIPLSRKYNRSVVAPPEPLIRKIGRWTIITLFIVTLILIAAVTIQNRLGLALPTQASQTHSIQEVRTWQSLWPAS